MRQNRNTCNFLIVLRKAIYAAVFLCSTLAHNLAFAEREMTIIVPYGVGGTQDILIRSFSQELSETLGTPVMIKNVPGAGGTIGTALVAHAKADGKTLLFASNSHYLSTLIYPSLSYDPIKNFTGVALIARGGMFLGIPSSLNIQTLLDYIQYIKNHPNQFNYASAGNGSTSHLAMAFFLAQFDLKMQHIPTKSAKEVILEVMSGRVQGGMFAISNVAAAMNNHQVRFIAYTSYQRDPHLLDIPTVEEQTDVQFFYDGWIGLLAPRGIPNAEIERINLAMQKVLTNPSVAAKLSRFGITTTPMSVNAFNAFLAQDVKDAALIFKSVSFRD
jgi:tripartite-type tricarboxylate transporter receptor subunit TctC